MAITLKKFLGVKDPEKTLGDLRFEEALDLLEQLVSEMEKGTLPLDDALTAFERGVLLENRLRDELSAAEVKLEKLQKKRKARTKKR